MSQRGVFATNLEKLLLYSLDDDNLVSEDCKKMIVKISALMLMHNFIDVQNPPDRDGREGCFLFTPR